MDPPSFDSALDSASVVLRDILLKYKVDLVVKIQPDLQTHVTAILGIHSVDTEDAVAGLDTSEVGGTSAHDRGNNRWASGSVLRDHRRDGEEQDGKKQVDARAGGENTDANGAGAGAE